MTDSKRCPACSTVKPLTDFNRHRSTKDGHQSHCRECQTEKMRAYLADPAHRAKHNERARLAMANHRARIKQALALLPEAERAKLGL